MLINKIKNRRNVFRNLIVSYLLILLIPFGIGSFVYLEAVHLVKEDALKNNLKILQQTKDILDVRLDEVEAISKQMAMNPKVISLMNVKQFKQGSPEYYKVWELLNTIPKYDLTNKFLRDIYVLFRNNELVVTSSTSYPDSRSFYKQVFKGTEKDYEDFRSMLWGRGHQREYVAAGHNAIYYLQSIPLDVNKHFQGMIMISINEHAIRNLLTKVDIGNNGLVYIHDDHGQVITEIRGKEAEVAPGDIVLNEVKDGLFTTESGRDLIIYKTTSKYNNWTYVSAVPAELVLSKVAYIKTVTLIVALITLICGTVMAGYLAYWNLKPLRGLMAKIRDFFGGDMDKSLNEYDYLDNTIVGLIQSNKTLHDKMRDQLPFIKMSLFRRLLSGEFLDEKEITALLSHVNINMGKKKFAVLILKIDNHENYIDRRLLQRMDMVKLIVHDLLDQVTETEYYTYDLDQTNTVLILSFEERESDKECDRIIVNLAQVVCDKLNRDYKTKLVFSTGRTYEGIRHISTSFDEAKRAMEYVLCGERTSLIRYQDIPRNNHKYFYPIELEMRLISLVKSGGKEEVKAIFAEIYKENIERRNLSPAMVKQLIQLIRGSVVRGFGHPALDQSMIDSLENSAAYSNVEDIFVSLKEAYLQICDMVNNQKSQTKLMLREKVIDYLNRTFMEEDLTLYRVASHFEYNETYMYQFFKENLGVTFAEYLEKLRIQHACQLMAEEDLTIKEVARQIGYNSDHTFRRAFKRVMGLVPTEYSKAIKEVHL
jgi:two-component system response regulator YesN